LQKFVAVHASVQNHFNQERHLYSRRNFKRNRAAARVEWRALDAPQETVTLSLWRLVLICLTAPIPSLKSKSRRLKVVDPFRNSAYGCGNIKFVSKTV